MASLHESDKLNALLGKRVRVEFFDGDIKIGILEKSKPPHIDGYAIDNLHFRKSHIVKIKEV